MTDVLSSQASTLAVVDPGSPIQASQVSVLALGIYPTEAIESSQVSLMAVAEPEVDIEASQVSVLAVAKGRIVDPTLKAWTYSQDGHDFYVLHLGGRETLVYDTVSEEWYTWGTGTSNVWRAATGTTWLGGTMLGANSSNIVVGDDSNGALYFLDPVLDTDDHPLTTLEEPWPSVPFDRVVTGQVLTPRGYNNYPCFGVQLMGSIGQTEDVTLTDVTLEYSDDRGKTYTSAGTITTTSEDYETRVNWLSLGSFRSPGRLFRVTDNGALKRVDTLNMSGPDGDST